jgi:hypothetical protein
MKSTATTQGEHFSLTLMSRGKKRSGLDATVGDLSSLPGFPSMRKGDIVRIFYRKSVLVIHGKNNNDDGK